MDNAWGGILPMMDRIAANDDDDDCYLKVVRLVKLEKQEINAYVF